MAKNSSRLNSLICLSRCQLPQTLRQNSFPDMWRELIPATRELTDNQAEATAEDVPEMEQPADKQAEAEESSAPPETFLMWLREALHEEVGEADAEGLVAAVEVILGDPE